MCGTHVAKAMSVRGIVWLRGMTLEAVDAYRRIVMTGAAEMFVSTILRVFTLFVRDNMAINTLNQTMFLGTNTFTHSQITLMQDKIHMLLTHQISRLYALLSLTLRNIWGGRGSKEQTCKGK
jgi:hypothetical protein